MCRKYQLIKYLPTHLIQKLEYVPCMKNVKLKRKKEVLKKWLQPGSTYCVVVEDALNSHRAQQEDIQRMGSQIWVLKLKLMLSRDSIPIPNPHPPGTFCLDALIQFQCFISLTTWDCISQIWFFLAGGVRCCPTEILTYIFLRVNKDE